MDTKILYHRGDEKNAPANTLLAFEAASGGEPDGVELDVQFTRDNVPVVFHDRTLGKHTGADGYLRDYSLSELRKIELDIPGDNPPQFIPTLEEVLDVIGNMEIINIEIKQRAGENIDEERELVRTVEKKGLLDKVIFSSFNHYSIKNLNKIAPDAKKGIIYYARLYEPWKYAESLGVDYIVPLYRTVTEEVLSEAKERELELMTYGTNNSDKLKRLLKNNVDMIITDDVETALKLRKNML